MGSSTTPHEAHMVLKTGDARVIVIGDVHGCADELQALLNACEYNADAGDQVVLIGDLVNKGPSSAQVVHFAMTNGFHAVLGNHDVKAVSKWDKWSSSGSLHKHCQHGKYAYLTELDEKQIGWLRHLPLTITLSDQANTLLVHAGLVPGVALHEQQPEDLYSIRNVVPDDAEDSNKYKALYDVSAGTPWAEAWDGCTHGHTCKGCKRQFVLFGHDAPRGLQQYKYAWGIDTKCCNGGCLTACILPERKLFTVPSFGRLHNIGEDGDREWRPHKSNRTS